MQYFMHKITQVGYPLEENGEDADDDGILFEGVHTL
jgi:hypothetical protein